MSTHTYITLPGFKCNLRELVCSAFFSHLIDPVMTFGIQTRGLLKASEVRDLERAKEAIEKDAKH
jgi:hypothetical protein